MSDELDGADATDAGAADAQGAVVTQPKRPTGKRSRQLANAADSAAADRDEAVKSKDAKGGAEPKDAKDSQDAKTGKGAKSVKGARGSKGAKGSKDSQGPSRNPFLFVFNYLKQVVNELRRVIWPNRKQMITYTSVVLAFLVFMVTLVALSDYGLAKLVMLVFGQNT